MVASSDCEMANSSTLSSDCFTSPRSRASQLMIGMAGSKAIALRTLSIGWCRMPSNVLTTTTYGICRFSKKSIEVKFTRALKKAEQAAVTQAANRYAEFAGLNAITLFR